MTFVFISNHPERLRILEAAAKELGVTSKSFQGLESAFQYIKVHKVDGIITDMSYRYREDDSDSYESNAGNILLILLKSQKKEIPVKGIFDFDKEFNKGINYSFYKGNMYEDFLYKNLEEFVASIKDHDN